VQNGLLESMIFNIKGLGSKQGSMLVYALGCMGANIDKFTPAVRDNVFLIALSVLSERPSHVVTASRETQQVMASF
jgi:hypothetical protein